MEMNHEAAIKKLFTTTSKFFPILAVFEVHCIKVNSSKKLGKKNSLFMKNI